MAGRNGTTLESPKTKHTSQRCRGRKSIQMLVYADAVEEMFSVFNGKPSSACLAHNIFSDESLNERLCSPQHSCLSLPEAEWLASTTLAKLRWRTRGNRGFRWGYDENLGRLTSHGSADGVFWTDKFLSSSRVSLPCRHGYGEKRSLQEVSSLTARWIMKLES